MSVQDNQDVLMFYPLFLDFKLVALKVFMCAQ